MKKAATQEKAENKLDYERIRTFVKSYIKEDSEKLEEIYSSAVEREVPVIREDTRDYLRLLLNQVKPVKVLEIGTAVGYSALFMAEVTRMFRTLVDGLLLPDAIATRLNHALAEDNEQGMFVTMFIGLINLKTGHMEYCNAGHNPPLLDGEFMKMESNAPIGLWPELDYAGEEVVDMHGKTLFIYTDGINEAENEEREQFGDDRLKALLQKDLGDARQTSEAIHKAVEDFVGGAEPSDDLTKMCIKMR